MTLSSSIGAFGQGAPILSGEDVCLSEDLDLLWQVYRVLAVSHGAAIQFGRHSRSELVDQSGEVAQQDPTVLRAK
jgi:hypothetical protein